MAKQNLSMGVTGLDPMRPDTPLHELAPGALSKLSPLERGKKLKRTTKRLPDMASLVTPASILGK
jgi:hypothetical protein